MFSLRWFCSAHDSNERFEQGDAPKLWRFWAIEARVFLLRKRFFRTGRGPSAEAGWKSALRGDSNSQSSRGDAKTRREEDVFRMILGKQPYSSNLQPPACLTRSTIARISIASSNPRNWPSENRSEQETSSIQTSSNDHLSQRSMQRTLSSLSMRRDSE